MSRREQERLRPQGSGHQGTGAVNVSVSDPTVKVHDNITLSGNTANMFNQQNKQKIKQTGSATTTHQIASQDNCTLF